MLSCSLSMDKARNRDSLKKVQCTRTSLLIWLYIIKRKFKWFFVEYGFYFTCEVKNMYISFVASPLMKYKYFPLHSIKTKSENKHGRGIVDFCDQERVPRIKLRKYRYIQVLRIK